MRRPNPLPILVIIICFCWILVLDGCRPAPTPVTHLITTVFVVRHAEYCLPSVDPGCDLNDPDPKLGSVGIQRAQELVHVLGKANVQAIYSTETKRTRGTAQPLAGMLEIELSPFTDPEQVASQVLSDHVGGVVLIVGHQPMMRAIVNELGGNGDRCAITTNEFDNLCMVTVYNFHIVNTVRLQYGDSSLPDSGNGVNTTIRIKEGTTDGRVLATVSSLIPASVITGAQPLGYFELLDPLPVTPGSPYILEWMPPGDAILTWMATEANLYPNGTAFGCSGLAIADEDFVFNTYRALMPFAIDQISVDETGKSCGCGTPTAGHLYQSFVPSASTLSAVDLRLRAGGDFPTEANNEMTTVLLIRHAERANDSLTVDGWIRAERLSHVVLKTGVSAVYASTAVSTQQTVERLADLLGIQLNIYTKTETLAQKILSDYKGEVILVSGSQPTVPELINLLGGDSSACDIDSEYDNLCVITILDSDEVEVMNLQYGKPAP